MNRFASADLRDQKSFKRWLWTHLSLKCLYCFLVLELLPVSGYIFQPS